MIRFFAFIASLPIYWTYFSTIFMYCPTKNTHFFILAQPIVISIFSLIRPICEIIPAFLVHYQISDFPILFVKTTGTVHFLKLIKPSCARQISTATIECTLRITEQFFLSDRSATPKTGLSLMNSDSRLS